MHFSISLDKKYDSFKVKDKIRVTAVNNVLRYSHKSTERALDRYIKEQYKMSLEDLCLVIIYSTKIEQVAPREYTVIIPDPRLDDAARLITFGDGKLFGSNILLKAFDWKGV